MSTGEDPAPPPIITYPEFLHSHQSATSSLSPQWTIQNLALTAGLVYGCARYLLRPRMQTRDEARHDRFIHMQARLEALNARLTAIAGPLQSPDTADAFFTQNKATQTEDQHDSAGQPGLSEQLGLLRRLVDSESAVEEELVEFKEYLRSLCSPSPSHISRDVGSTAELQRQIFTVKGLLLTGR